MAINVTNESQVAATRQLARKAASRSRLRSRGYVIRSTPLRPVVFIEPAGLDHFEQQPGRYKRAASPRAEGVCGLEMGADEALPR